MPKTGRQYAGMVLLRAWSKAWAEARSGAALVGIVIGGAALMWTIAPDTRTGLTWEVPLALAVVFFLYRLCTVSYQAYATLETKANEMEEQLVDKINHQALADQLTAQHERGKSLIRPSGDQRAEYSWDADIKAWVDDTLEIMRRHGCNRQEMHHVESITNIDLVGVATGFTGKARAIVVRTQRIADISTRHAQIAEDIALAPRKKE